MCLCMSWAKGRGCCMGGGDRKHSQRWPSISLFAPHSCPHSHKSRRVCHKLQSRRSNFSSPETHTHICRSLQSASLSIIPSRHHRARAPSTPEQQDKDFPPHPQETRAGTLSCSHIHSSILLRHQWDR